MTTVRAAPSRSALATWALCAAACTGAALVLLVPSWRSAAVVLASVVSVALVGAGCLLHRPRGAAWPLVGLMLALWGVAGLHVQAVGELVPAATAAVWGGQAVAAVLVVGVVRGRAAGGRRAREPGGRLDLVVIATVLALVGAQLVAVAAADHEGVAGAVVASVDVVLVGMLLRFTVAARGLSASSWLLLAGGLLTVVYDLTSALDGRRLALPGEPEQALGALCVLVLGAAALHPSMAVAFAPETFARQRPPSAALLGLLPLVGVPAALWWVAQRSSVPGLPGWTVPVAGAVIAGLCLVRAAAALRSSEHLAEHDPLTDLANRRGLVRAYADPAPAGGRSLLLVDVDEFKQVNDTHGHDVGDALLLALRDRLLAATGPAGVVARLGGDEFVVLTGTAGAGAVARRVLDAFGAPVVVDGLVLRVGASVGVADAGPGTPLAELLTHADVAMYAAKGAGGQRVAVFHPDMRAQVAHRYSLSSDIRRLLGGRAPEVGHLEVHFQPLVDLRTEEVVGAEALVRWRHPEHGLLLPGAFLELVNSNDLDDQLDLSVLEDVLEQLARWRAAGHRSLPVSVNLTRASLDDPDLAERVLGALARTGVPASQLHVEITEHEPLPEDSPAARSLEVLSTAGVDVLLDDYGTGYTSLDHLQRFPVDVLKLDRSVVSAVTRASTPLVAGVQAMAAALDLQVLAEGVETPEQREHLLALGVRLGQGYLFSRPLPAAEYADRFLGPAAVPPPVPARGLPVAGAGGR
ncbi:putative bifunctional diguanylate cyclase/phosphodiesterase [Kineococcus sp. SYSU DK006]|uniref:putative bifunctional diguanylate cyclase/phosphodiesterase n=1 Tax=Kineococcus sp. SYSU DK006 TaxID=3383127 RepID=UPI003D7CD2DC